MKITPSDPEDKLHAAVAQSNKTGEPVELAPGVYRTTRPIILEGGIILAPRASKVNNWNSGAAVLHARHPDTAIIMLTRADGANPLIENLNIVCYHCSTGGKGAGIEVAPNGPWLTAATLTNVLIDGAYNGLVLQPGTAQHRVRDLTIRSFRRSGLWAPDNTKVVDCHFSGTTYIAGKPHADYVPGAIVPPNGAIGIDGLPASSLYDSLVIEYCARVNLHIGATLNQRIMDLFCDSVLDTAVSASGPYTGKDYSKRALIQSLTAQTAVKARLYGVLPKAQLRVISTELATIGAGTWTSTTL